MNCINFHVKQRKIQENKRISRYIHIYKRKSRVEYKRLLNEYKEGKVR